MARHVTSTHSLPSTATVLLYKPWDVFAAVLSHLARKAAALLAFHWIRLGATAPSPRIRPCTILLACKGSLVKVPGLLRTGLPMLVAQRMNQIQILPREASLPRCAAPKANRSSNFRQRVILPALAARTTNSFKKHE